MDGFADSVLDFRSVQVFPGGLADDGLVAEEALQNVAGQGSLADNMANQLHLIFCGWNLTLNAPARCFNRPWTC